MNSFVYSENDKQPFRLQMWLRENAHAYMSVQDFTHTGFILIYLYDAIVSTVLLNNKQSAAMQTSFTLCDKDSVRRVVIPLCL